MTKLLYLIPIIFILLSSCKKRCIKKNCCTGTIEILTENYKTDSIGIYAPNAFTPNGDGINDFFRIYLYNSLHTNYAFKVFKKKKEVFSTCDASEAWSGIVNGKIKRGRYNYTIQFKTIHNEIIQAKGEFCLLDHNNPIAIENCNSCLFGDMIDPRHGIVNSESLDHSWICD